ncbi:MAG: NAD-dependent epimerase/dehydratase family protein [Nitrospirales bacterium]
MGTILVTGGNGYLGSMLVARLIQNGQVVRVLARAAKTGERSVPTSPEVVYGDIRDPEAVDAAVKDAEVVIHLVSNFRKGGSDKDDAYAVNVEGTKNVLNAARKYDVQRFIHCSTIGVHGDVQEIPANEQTPFNPTDLYQETKLIAEQAVWKFYEETNLPITVIRPISLFGPGDLRMLKLFRMIKKGQFIMVGKGEALFQPAFIDDVVDGFLLCLEKKQAVGQAFIIGGEQYVPLKELVSLIAHELDVNVPHRHIPLKPALWAASLCEKICVPFGIEPPLHRRRMSFFQNNRAFSVEKAKTILGYKPKTSLRKAIRQTIDWYEANNWM